MGKDFKFPSVSLGRFCFHRHSLLFLTPDGFIGDFIGGFIEDLNRHRLTKKLVTMSNRDMIITTLARKG